MFLNRHGKSFLLSISLLFICLFSCVNPLPAQNPRHVFALGDSTFLLDGKPFQMISGEMHYPRIPREYWRDRMKMAKAMGLNCIGTYVFWNAHEAEEGKYDFTGNNDIAGFVRIAKEEGLWVVLRPSPYVCAEWEFGGYPWWLLRDSTVKVRSKDPRFVDAYRRYINELSRQLTPLLITHGGNILMVQIENEYGSYSNDKSYLELNRRLFRQAGFDGILFTCDGADKMGNGYLPGYLPAVNGEENPTAAKEVIRKYHEGKGPFYLAEWYPGWFDNWGRAHAHTGSKRSAETLDKILSAGLSINMYMFHGGSTRGFMNGANMSKRESYSPQVSSYDYDAPLDEAGNPTEKFYAFREVIARRLPPGESLPPVPERKKTMAINDIKLSACAGVFNNLPGGVASRSPLCFEDLGQAYGFVLYRTRLADEATGWLKINGLRDFAIVYVNGRQTATLDRRLRQDSLRLENVSPHAVLDIWVENNGRINYGPFLTDNRQGITGAVTLDGRTIHNWTMYGFPFLTVCQFKFGPAPIAGQPALYKGSFSLDEVNDTYLDMRGFGKGFVFLNGINLGKYWEIGPQQTLYVPSCWLRKGVNEVLVFDELKDGHTTLNALAHPVLNELPASPQDPPKPYGALPTATQLAWHETEMYCLIHFGVDTYTDKEWGYGDEDPAIVNPVDFDAMQIVGAARAGGFKGVVVVAKHHDGLCLWPSKTTEHTISKSPWRGGRGDMVKEYQRACDKLGMRLGIYCSPWDRNNPQYGTAAYVQIYRAQLKELYTNYGPLFMSWHDGANGGDGYYGGARNTRRIDRTTYYGWDTTWAITRKLQPGAAIFGDVGPDVRWVGNEEGHAGQTCWATYTPHAPDPGMRPANGYSKYEEATEGTRNGEFWMPAECDVPLRPGWFYHASQDQQVKSPYQLLDLYYQSVGRGASLDLGIAPNRKGLLDQRDVASLKAFGDLLKQTFAVNLARGARLTASNIRGNNMGEYGPSRLTDDDRYSYWATDDSVTTAQLTIDLGKPTTFNVIRLRENIKLGQRIGSFTVEAYEAGQWKPIGAATSIGANRLIRMQQNVVTDKVRLSITHSAACIALSDLGLFKEPPHLVAPSVFRDKKDLVHIETPAPVAAIHYSLDGTDPGPGSPNYSEPFPMPGSGIVRARSFEADHTASEVTTRELGLSKSGWKVIGSVPEVGSDSARAGGRGRVEWAIDDVGRTVWSTLQRDSAAVASLPQELIIDMGKLETIRAFTYLPRQDKRTEGIADRYIFYTSKDGTNWQKAAEGEFANIKSNPLEQLVTLHHPLSARYFKFSILHVVSGNGVVVAEVGVR
ncbi:MAG: beta-galactosidase [Bacteroidota bacterium]|nr:beta-galactosidase [Bacteroidota bacterium]MDP4259859.1 beta-galactosidase [Bacteroidota bacterium]